jgi:hypothetical protein
MDGKAAKKEGKSENLSEQMVQLSRIEVCQKDLEDKNGTSPDRLKSVRGFFLPRALNET